MAVIKNTRLASMLERGLETCGEAVGAFSTGRGLVVICALISLLLIASSHAETARPIIAVVNVQRIIHESAAGKGLDLQYDKAHQQFSDGVAEQERDLDRQEQTLNHLRTILAADAFKAQREALEAHSAEVQRTIQQQSQANQLAFNDAFAGLANTIRVIVAAVAKEQAVTVVLPQDQVLYLGDEAIDITDTVLSRVDSKLPTISVVLPKTPPLPPPAGKPR